MLRKILLITVLLAVFTVKGYPQSLLNLKEINEVYLKFETAFDSLDYNLFAEIHSKKLIRIPGGKRILDYTTYTEKQRKNFEKAQKEHSTRSIDLRFFERVNNDSTASERGYYKYIRNKNLPDEKISYGKFHVLLIKEDDEWKILMDYDSNEGVIIREEDFNSASDMYDFDRFISQ